VMLTYDDRNLYAAFRCLDPAPAAIRAHLTDREDFWTDDHVNIHIDTFNDQRRNFSIGTNPFGVQMDGVANAGRGFDWSWDAIWDSAGRIHDWGYAVEMAIPFSQLAFQRADGPQVWGFDAWRVYPRDVQRFIGVVPQDRDDNCWQCQMVKIAGFAGATPGRDIEIAPTLTAVRTDARPDFPAGDFQRENEDTEFGVTGQWGLTSNFNLAGTWNPDFSQIEADALQLDINQPFALWYAERRPFFTEGADIFGSLKDAIYTRTLRDPVWGAKLTGKEGPHSVGAYLVRDELTNLIFPDVESSGGTSLDRESTAAAVRTKHDVGRDVTLGAMYTGREGDGYRNRLGGLDATVRLSSRDQIQIQALTTSTRYPDAVAADNAQPEGEFSGEFLAFEYDHEARNLGWWFDLEEVDAGFRADLGFIPRVGYRNAEGGVHHTWYNDADHWWNRLFAHAMYFYDEDLDGRPVDRAAQLQLVYNGPLQSYLGVTGLLRRQVYDGRDFDQTSCAVTTGLYPSGQLEIWLRTGFGDRIDYANTRPGERFYLGAETSLNLGRHLRLDLDYTYERLDVDLGRLYTAHVAELRAVYQFSVRAFFRAILQRVHYRREVERYLDEVDADSRHLFTQLLFSYKLNPRTVMFLGYSDNYLGNQDYGLTQADRSVFAKLGYAWGL
jgi:hypothetical protein